MNKVKYGGKTYVKSICLHKKHVSDKIAIHCEPGVKNGEGILSCTFNDQSHEWECLSHDRKLCEKWDCQRRSSLILVIFVLIYYLVSVLEMILVLVSF